MTSPEEFAERGEDPAELIRELAVKEHSALERFLEGPHRMRALASALLLATSLGAMTTDRQVSRPSSSHKEHEARIAALLQATQEAEHPGGLSRPPEMSDTVSAMIRGAGEQVEQIL